MCSLDSIFATSHHQDAAVLHDFNAVSLLQSSLILPIMFHCLCRTPRTGEFVCISASLVVFMKYSLVLETTNKGDMSVVPFFILGTKAAVK